MNVSKYIENVTRTENGVVYKSPKPFSELSDNEIAYISEGCLENIIDNATMGYDFTDEELVRVGFAETKATIREALEAEYPVLTDDLISEHRLDETVYDLSTWESPTTVIARLWEDEEFQDLICE